jgi:RNA polymerase sigma factor (sigma-70 family)
VNQLTDQQLLREYAERRSEAAFAELVRRHVDLIYSAALRMVCDSHLAQDVTQGTFVALARSAPHLTERAALSGWLHRTTQNIAAQTVRTDVRRRAREQEAAAMNELFATESDGLWERIAPHLDAALGELSEVDRDALLLRYFERKSAQEMAQVLGVSDEAAQKRVSRAVERLREFFAKRGVTVGASGLVVVISANAVQAAPVGLAVAISTTVALAGTTVTATATATAVKTIAMTTLQKTLVAATIAVMAGAGIYEIREASQLREQNQALQQQQASFATQLQQLERERSDATKRLAALAEELARVKKNPSEVLRLRGEVGVLRQEKAIAAGESAASRVLADPETRKAIHERNKTSMSALYSGLALRLKLTPEQTGQLNDLLSDHAMDSAELVTRALRDGRSQAEARQIFSASDAALQARVQALLGDDGLAQYRDYTKNLGSAVFIETFAPSLTGDPATVADKKSRLLQIMQEMTQSAVAAAGLPADYQTFTVMNPCNFVSEEEAAQSLQLKDNIFGEVAARASAFLTADELNKLQEYRTNAIKNAQNFLLMERKLMSPVSGYVR